MASIIIIDIGNRILKSTPRPEAVEAPTLYHDDPTSFLITTLVPSSRAPYSTPDGDTAILNEVAATPEFDMVVVLHAPLNLLINNKVGAVSERCVQITARRNDLMLTTDNVTDLFNIPHRTVLTGYRHNRTTCSRAARLHRPLAKATPRSSPESRKMADFAPNLLLILAFTTL